MIHGAIAAGTSQYGMQTFDQSIFSLYQQGLVTLEEALRWASNVDEFKLKVQGISTTADMARDEMAPKRRHRQRPGDHAVLGEIATCEFGRRSTGPCRPDAIQRVAVYDSRFPFAIHVLRTLCTQPTSTLCACWDGASCRSRQLRARLLDREHPRRRRRRAPSPTCSRTRALDDGRVARAYARTAAKVKGRGRLRVQRELQAMGIANETSRPKRSPRCSATSTSARSSRGRSRRSSAAAAHRLRRRARAALSVPDAPGLQPAASAAALRKLGGRSRG